ncbi:hypothetical protein QRX60_35490 [Amycolatopsis mongoliensis]|uniref:Uncharacterized protein n=1 Tax=Amycolatopsis mongoliensis TaxID=715475 RepID=A0A9Y2NB70_9PSEU|nr:hypothetical protein [Amycolatopsis sp. 4-36]WIX99325.1 hypothetical protein QRX60_35490 [Amycolatopsis sp. 4-36]
MTGSLASADPHARSHEIVGGRALDAADPTHNVPAAACLVCGRTDRRVLHRVSLTPPDMAAASLPASEPPVLCLTHYAAAMRSVGTPTPTGNCPRCIACGFDDPGYFGPVATFPLQSGIPVTQPVYRACARHLAEAIAALTQEASA